MRRCFSILLSVLLLMTITPVVSADIVFNDDQLNWGGMYDPTAPCTHRTCTRYEVVASTCTTHGRGAYAQCNDCGILLEGSDLALPLLDHTYDHDCDTDCNVCGAAREVGPHVYDDERDPTCNHCGDVRDVTLLGDADGDGRVNNRDYGLLQQYLNEWSVTVDMDAVDMNDDDLLNNRDLALLQRYLNEL